MHMAARPGRRGGDDVTTMRASAAVAAAAFLLLSLLVAAAAAAAQQPLPDDELPLQVQLQQQGRIEGFHDHEKGSRSFLGVPFAAPPLDDLRWELPRPHLPWSGVRPAKAWAPGCLTGGKGPSHENGTVWSEDCLYLNIFTPQRASPGEKLPVLFFYHGGTSSATIYPAGRLANSTQSIVVTVQYRQGPFGYLVLPELLASGAVNLASEDSLFALQWVQNNIGQFNGNPDRVLIFGQSAGAGFVLWNLVWPKAYNLYSSAIIESTGGGGCDYKVNRLNASMQLAAQLGCTDIACLRHVNATELASAGGESIAIQCCDCGTIPDSPAKLIKAGRFNTKVPIMIGCAAFEQAGTTSHRCPEQNLSVADYSSEVAKKLKSARLKHPMTTQEYMAAYSPLLKQLAGPGWFDDEERARWFTLATMQTDKGAKCAAEDISNWLANGTTVYRFVFSHSTKNWDRTMYNASHGSELPYVFNDPSVLRLDMGYRSFDTAEVLLAKQMSAAWVQFARTGSPEVPGGLLWPPYQNTANGMVMNWNTGASLQANNEWKQMNRQCVLYTPKSPMPGSDPSPPVPSPPPIADWVISKDMDALPTHPGPCWQSLGEPVDAAACAAKCNGSIFVWHHPPPAHCHCCSCAQPIYTARLNKRVDSGCRPAVSGCGSLPPSPAPHPLPPPLPLDPNLPTWIGEASDPSKPNHGMQLMPNRRQITVYNSTTPAGGNNTNGLYNHGPMVLFFNNIFLCSWYNSPLRESHGMRVLMASSADAVAWSEPHVVFPSVDSKGEENEPFPVINGRLYGLASDVNWGNAHDTGEQGWALMRRIINSTSLGPIFWLSRSTPPSNATWGKGHYPLFSAMDATTSADAEQYLRSLVNETVTVPLGRRKGFSERSLYTLPTRRSGEADAETELVLLLRSSAYLSASRCVLPPDLQRRDAEDTNQRTEELTFSCKSGTGAYMFEQPSAIERVAFVTSPRAAVTCNWTVPAITNIPDAPSRTCAGHLPHGLGIGIIGNNGGPPGGGRDPLTFLMAKDGIHFSTHWVVEIGAPTPKWPSLGHPHGFQYPSFVWCVTCGVLSETILFSYSVSKEDIVITMAPLASIRNAPTVTQLKLDDESQLSPVKLWADFGPIFYLPNEKAGIRRCHEERGFLAYARMR